MTWTGDTPSSVLRFTHQDGHGSTRALSDASGALLGDYTYDAFGILRNSQGGFDLHHRYCGEFFDADLGMYYLRARWYQPELGRFWTMDTYEGRSGEPLTLHKYLYANCDPIRFSDPSGNFSSLTEASTYLFVVASNLMFNYPIATALVAGGLTFTSLMAYADNPEMFMQMISASPNGAIGVVEADAAFIMGGLRSVASKFSALNRSTSPYRMAQEMADFWQNLPIAASRKPNTFAVLRSKDGQIIFGRNSGGIINDNVETALTQIPSNAYTGACAEVNAIAAALNKGIDVRGATISVIYVRSSANALHGTPRAPCPVCDELLGRFGVNLVNQ